MLPAAYTAEHTAIFVLDRATAMLYNAHVRERAYNFPLLDTTEGVRATGNCWLLDAKMLPPDLIEWLVARAAVRRGYRISHANSRQRHVLLRIASEWGVRWDTVFSFDDAGNRVIDAVLATISEPLLNNLIKSSYDQTDEMPFVF